jgi:molybdate transport system substrate-binding protein
MTTRMNGASVHILCAGAMHPIIDALAGPFERASGLGVAAQFASSRGVKERVMAGERVDLAITIQAAIDDLGKQGKILPESATPLARSRIGVAVRAGAPRPDIQSVESFKRAMLQANSIALADPATGSPSATHVFGVIEHLGMTAELQPKIRLARAAAGAAVLVGEIVAGGEAEIGVQQIAEILAVPGVDFAGALPTELQHVSVLRGGCHDLGQPDTGAPLDRVPRVARRCIHHPREGHGERIVLP